MPVCIIDLRLYLEMDRWLMVTGGYISVTVHLLSQMLGIILLQNFNSTSNEITLLLSQEKENAIFLS